LVVFLVLPFFLTTAYTVSMNTIPLKIVQISDTHLFADENGEIAGRNTLNSFLAVRDLVLAEHPNPDMIFLTGDLSQDFSEAAYERLTTELRSFTCPIYWIPGNHDHSSDLPRILSTTQCLDDKEIVTDDWQIVLLDSSLDGKVYGEFSDDELVRFKEVVDRYPEKYLFVFLHHHPVPINVAWLEHIGLHNPEKFLETVRSHPKLRVIAWGHIHQQFEMQEGDVQYLSVPSTCVQFSPDSNTFALDTRLPGYRWFELNSNGEVKTGVNRLKEFDDGIDYTSTGY